MSYGRFLDEFHPGVTFRHEPARTISALDIELVRWLATGRTGSLTGRDAPQHHDRVPLWLLVALCIGMSGRDISARALGNRSLRDVVLQRDVAVGTTVRCLTRVEQVEAGSTGGAGLVTVASRLEDLAGEQVLSLRRVIVIPARDGSG